MFFMQPMGGLRNMGAPMNFGGMRRMPSVLFPPGQTGLSVDNFIFDRQMPVEMPGPIREIQKLKLDLLKQGTPLPTRQTQPEGFKDNTGVETPTQTGAGVGTAGVENQSVVDNAPKFIDQVDTFKSDAKFFLPWDEAENMGMKMDQWVWDRESGLNYLDGVKSDRSFALEAMQQRLEEIARKKAEVQRRIEEKKSAEEAKKREMEQKKNEIENLKQTGSKEEIEAKLREVKWDIGDIKGAINEKQSKIDQLKQEKKDNPERADEIQSQIDELEGDVSGKKYNLEQKQARKRELEEKKTQRERKAEENKRKKEAARRELERMQEELKSLRAEQSGLESSVNEINGSRNNLQSKIEEKEAHMDRLEWLIADFRFNTEGME